MLTVYQICANLYMRFYSNKSFLLDIKKEIFSFQVIFDRRPRGNEIEWGQNVINQIRGLRSRETDRFIVEMGVIF